MDLKQMTYFITIVKYHSFSKAARALHISQPSLSNSIQNLERELGTPLLERTTRNLQLTEVGKLLYERANIMLQEMNILQEEIQDIIDGDRVEIIIGMIESANRWFARLMYEHKQTYPHNDFTLIDTLYSKTVLEALLRYEVHAVVTNQEIIDETIEAVPLYTEKFVVVLPNNHPLMFRENIDLQDLCNVPLILGMPSFQTCSQIMRAFEHVELKPQIEFQIERFEMAKILVENGAGITILPENYVKDALPSTLSYRYINNDLLQRTVYFCYVKNRHFPSAILSFFQLIKNNFKITLV
ncbi:LysR family transcriptional regulator [Rummeliibacillus pycnus]|uniref:LysR family transcriptional regulator n=1 Tax=Rummeliibacillus pycnus TaxID=101070 RepID=UPI0037CA4DC7